MSERLAIKVENVSKIYMGGQIRRVSLRHEAMQLLKGLLFGKSSVSHTNRFYALKNISFDVYAGESVGIIGRNGAGKSTILRLLAGITTPTFGNVEVNGRQSALIELGTGFHPDLTGRQNIFLNGAIHGIRPREMNKVIDKIIAFADIGSFIDSPLRNYSNGMIARLGFSVAVNVSPDVILIDEVLAVGDEAFRNKCQRFMFDMLEQDKTVIFVSHVLPEIEKLCRRVIWLDKGEIIRDEATATVIKDYKLFIKTSESEQYEGGYR